MTDTGRNPPAKPVERIREEALDWVIRLRGGGAADWEAFAAWMESDTRAPAVYWSLADADAGVAEALSAPRPAVALPPPVRSAPGRRHWLTGGIVALAASILLILVLRPESAGYRVVTAPGETREVALETGSDLLLNGGTEVLLDRRRPREVRLVRGEARFTVAHDASRPFRVQVGDAELVDLGTRFAVTHDRGRLTVAVAEGRVRYSAGNLRRDLSPGDILEVDAKGRAIAGRVDPGDVAAWAEGRLVYNRADAARVAADLSRTTGLEIAVAPGVADKPFSGGLRLGARDAGTVRRAASLMGLTVRRQGTGWILEEPAPGSR